MRTIKFRGKRIDGEWVYGYYAVILNKLRVDSKETILITPEGYYEVLPESVGQWTGLVDKHGKEIFEGDVVFYDNRMKLEVKYDNRTAQFTTDEYWLWSIVDYSEIIGNIHDNPELMEVE